MSTLASLDILISKRGQGAISAVEILQLLFIKGWNATNNGKILYLPLGDDDDFDWQEQQLSISELLNIVSQKEKQGEIIGVGVTWESTMIGGTLLIHSNCSLSFSLTINRKQLVSNITDVSWYLERILPCFETDTTIVEKFTFSQD